MFKFPPNSLVFEGGHSDELACQTCKILLASPEKYKSVEIIYAVKAVFTQHCIFTLSGAHYKNICLNGIKIDQNRVYEAHEQDVLTFSELMLGFRLYLMASPFEQSRIGCYRSRFEQCFSPAEKQIRVIKGPEFDYLDDPELFLSSSFIISSNSDLAGLRLEQGLEGAKIKAKQYDIISSIVADGIIQLTAKGPIVLLRDRQVTGGYPRVLSVIKTDLDFLAQYKIASVVRFKLIELAQAKTLLLQREQQLNKLRTKLCMH